jgi:hypothetical protein
VRLPRRLLAALVVGPAVAGCETRVGLNRARSRQLGRIGVVTPAVAATPAVPTEVWLSAPFGSIGRFVDAALQAERERLLAAALEHSVYRAGERWSAHLQAALIAAGFVPVVVPVARFDLAFLERYPPAGAEAYLDTVVAEYGYVAETPDSVFLPFASVQVRLASPRGRVLFQDSLVSNAFRPFGAVQVAGPTSPSFATPLLFPLDPERAAEGVDAALGAMAKQVVRRLR